MPKITRALSSERHVRKTITFDGTTGNGEVGTVTVFPITGRVFVRRTTQFCTESLAEAGATATISMGTSADIDAFVAATNAVDIDVNEWWGAASPAAGSYQLLQSSTAGFQTAQADKMLSQNIILTIGSQNVTDGTLVIDVWYEPITADGALA